MRVTGSTILLCRHGISYANKEATCCKIPRRNEPAVRLAVSFWIKHNHATQPKLVFKYTAAEATLTIAWQLYAVEIMFIKYNAATSTCTLSHCC